jgi:hypothetical protein
VKSEGEKALPISLSLGLDEVSHFERPIPRVLILLRGQDLGLAEKSASGSRAGPIAQSVLQQPGTVRHERVVGVPPGPQFVFRERSRMDSQYGRPILSSTTVISDLFVP